MRLLFIPSWYPSPKNPLAGTFIEDLTHDLVEQDVEITVAALHVNYRSLRKNYVYTNNDHLKVHHFFGWTPPKFNKTLQKSWIRRSLALLEAKFDIAEFDMIHAHDYIGLFLASVVARKYNKSLVASLHHSDILMDSIPAWRRKILIDDLAFCQAIIVPSLALKIATSKLTKQPISIIPNYINPEKITIKKSLPKKPRRLISVGSLDYDKNQLLAIKYVSEFSDLSLDVFGVGPEKRKLTRFIKNHNLQDRVFLKGSISHEKMLRSFADYDAIISTSKFETFGLALLEALACGIPAVCLNKYGPKDFIHGNNGFFINNEIKNPLAKLIEEYAAFNSNDISQDIVNRFSKKEIIIKYLMLYKSIL